jgi:hypothetical protein
MRDPSTPTCRESWPASACTRAAYAGSARPRPSFPASVGAAIQARVDAVAARDESLLDAIAAPVQACVHRMAAPAQRRRAPRVAMPLRPRCAAIKPCFDPVPLVVESVVDACTPSVEATRDAVAADVVGVLPLVSMDGGHRRSGGDYRQGASQGKDEGASHGILLCRVGPLQEETPLPGGG